MQVQYIYFLSFILGGGFIYVCRDIVLFGAMNLHVKCLCILLFLGKIFTQLCLDVVKLLW
jgi:hypothetical protein